MIYIIRHGKVHNPKNILYGRLKGYRLSKEGENQILKTAEFIQNKQIKKIFSSPLLRAKQTAIIIKNKLNFPELKLSNDLIDIKTSHQGKSYKLLESINLDFYSDKYRKPNDETIEEISLRMTKFINRILKEKGGENIVFITHADPILILWATLLRLPLKLESIRKFTPNYGEVFEVKNKSKNVISIKSVFKPM